MKTAGTILKEKRQSLKISLKFVSKELKITSEILNNIENDYEQYLIDSIYYIGHIRTYARFLGLDDSLIISIYKEQISFDKNKNKDKILKPILPNKKIRIAKPISTSLILIIFMSFYFLFISNNKDNSSDYALIPDLPEKYIPVIEKSDLDNEIKINSAENKNSLTQNIIEKNSSSVVASTKFEPLNSTNEKITLKFLNSTWLQIRDSSDNIILSKLMEKDEEYSYDINLEYNITSGNAGNILVIINNEVRGKIGKYGDVLDSYKLNSNFKN